MAALNSEVLNSWKEVSAYVGRGVRTVQRWEKDFGLPVRRPAGHLRGSVVALKTEIDQWLNTLHARDALAASSGDSRCEAAAPKDYQQLQEKAANLERECQRLTLLVEVLRAKVRLLESPREGSIAGKSISPTL